MSSSNPLVFIPSFLIILLPFLILTGPFLADSAVTLIGICFFTLVIYKKEYNYLQSRFFKIFIFFYFLIVTSSLLSENAFSSIQSTIPYLRFGLFSIGVWYFLDHDKDIKKYFFSVIIISFVLAILYAVYQILFFNNYAIDGRLQLLFSEKQILGGYLSRLFPLLIGSAFIFSYGGKFKGFIFLLLIILSSILIFLSGERTAIFIFLISIFSIFIFLSKFKKQKLILLIIIITSFVFITIFNKDIKNRNIDFTITQLNLENGFTNIRFFSHHHQILLSTSKNMFFENPLFGIGPNNYRFECDNVKYYIDDYSCSTHPHNIYAQALAEIGIIGFIILFSGFIYILYSLLKDLIYKTFNKTKTYTDYELCLLITMLLTVWPLVPSLNLFTNWINVVYFLPVGLFLHSIHSRNE